MNTVLTDEQRRLYQNPEVIENILETAKTIAVVGLSSNSQRASSFVASYLQYEGYRIIPVNPSADSILGETVYPDLQSIPDSLSVDVVDVFRPSHEVPAIVDQAIAIGAKCVWLQLRIIDFAAAQRATAAGLMVIMDKCVKMEHGRFGGSLHWAGMNTEIITARRASREPRFR